MKVEEAAKEYAGSQYGPDDKGVLYRETINDFIAGAEWQSKQSPWISVEDRLPKENENIIIMCEHGAIFNGTYCNGVWFCMDGYIHDSYKQNPIYSSMCSIPPMWKPTHWMPIPALPKEDEK